MYSTNGQRRQTIDFDVHGLVGIRLIDASPGDVSAVARQLGPVQRQMSREPDILIRFCDRLPLTSPLRYLGLNEAGYTDDAFLVLRSKHKAHARVQIPIAQIGSDRCEIVCERGLPAVPLLIPIINLTALARGALPLHASAFTYEGTGVLATGWSKGGKTETLLAFMAQGAAYIGDEWVYVSNDGQSMYGIPEPIRLWDWHLQHLPQIRDRVGAGDKIRLNVVKAATTIDTALQNGRGNRSFPATLLRRLVPLLRKQLHVDIPPDDLFGAQQRALQGNLDTVIFVVSHESPQVTVQPIDPLEIADRMVFSLQYERLDFRAYYLAFRFAFPQARNDLVEQAEEIQRTRLRRVLAGKDAYIVYHPYPVSIPDLFDAVRPLL